jgi:hypothetical protein
MGLNTSNELQVMENTPTTSTIDVDNAIQEWKAYQEVTKLILDDGDYQNIKGKRFKKKTAWRKYARAFNVSTEIIKEDIIKTEKGQVREATFIVRATLPTGRYSDGWGNCSRGEGSKNHPNHDIPATACTRACNRAISDLIGAGEVTAEEMQEEVKNDRSASFERAKKKIIKKDVIEADKIEE